jgi:hypothetical protein
MLSPDGQLFASPLASPADEGTSPTATSGSASTGDSAMSPRSKARVTHGLVPKAQLFVANPDREGSGGS